MKAIARTTRSKVLDLDTCTALRAAELSRDHGLSVADAVIYASAREHQAELVTSDGHFERLAGVTYFPKKGSRIAMQTNGLKAHAHEARRDFIATVTRRAAAVGLTGKDIKLNWEGSARQHRGAGSAVLRLGADDEGAGGNSRRSSSVLLSDSASGQLSPEAAKRRP